MNKYSIIIIIKETQVIDFQKFIGVICDKLGVYLRQIRGKPPFYLRQIRGLSATN